MADHFDRNRDQNQNVGAARIYCNYKDRPTQTVGGLVGSVLRQLVKQRSVASENIKKFYKKFHDHEKKRPRLSEVVKVLQAEISTFSKVYVIVDALDEFLDADQSDLAKTLVSLTNNNLMLLITSRPSVPVNEWLEHVERIDISANADDVRKYVESSISKLRLVKDKEKVRELIIDTIVNKVSGMFVSFSINNMVYVC